MYTEVFVFSDEGDDDEPTLKEEPRSKDNFRKRDLPIGTKLKVKYGRGRNQKIYEAKVSRKCVRGCMFQHLLLRITV